MQSFAKLILASCVIYTACISNIGCVIKNTPPAPGICEIEVPTVSILPPEFKHTAGSIKGNGSNPSLSKIKICCAGYTISPHAPLTCIPECPGGCGLGNCTAPNLCVCHKDSILGPEGKCMATCPKSCLNGQCYNNYCNCNRGFILESSGQYCIQGCTKNCGEGGICIGHDQCKCDTGYHLTKQGICTLFCEEGYHQVGSICEPMCPKGCLNGTCTAPNVCICNPGWVLENNGFTCKPSCSTTCLNGECTGPNICTCKPGYIKDPNDSKGNSAFACVRTIPQHLQVLSTHSLVLSWITAGIQEEDTFKLSSTDFEHQATLRDMIEINRDLPKCFHLLNYILMHWIDKGVLHSSSSSGFTEASFKEAMLLGQNSYLCFPFNFRYKKTPATIYERYPL
ncbi:hypothetical protein Trydic_g1435 [Trypoxylus dichotomus]